MVFRISFILFFSLFYLTAGYTTKAIDMDYFLSFLRNANCSTKEGLQECKELCHNVPVLCHNGECYCHQSVVDVTRPPNLVTSVDVVLAPKSPIPPTNDVQINISPQIVSNSDEAVPVLMLSNEPSHQNRRHQIAHFCPSLDVARDCIRKCVQLGKAAFCGKDHRCYCGHKYSSHDVNGKQNAAEIYKEFADMYAKYLGNSGRGNVQYDDYDMLLKQKSAKKKLNKT